MGRTEVKAVGRDETGTTSPLQKIEENPNSASVISTESSGAASESPELTRWRGSGDGILTTSEAGSSLASVDGVRARPHLAGAVSLSNSSASSICASIGVTGEEGAEAASSSWLIGFFAFFFLGLEEFSGGSATMTGTGIVVVEDAFFAWAGGRADLVLGPSML